MTNKAPAEARERFLEMDKEIPLRESNKKISPRTEQAIMLAMNIHPDQRFQSVADFKEALLGDWEPRLNPNGSMPAPNLREILKSNHEKLLAGIALFLLIASLVVTFIH